MRLIPSRPVRFLLYIAVSSVAGYRLAQYARLMDFGIVKAEPAAIPSLSTFDVPTDGWDLAHSRIGGFVATDTGLYVLVHHGVRSSG